MTSDQLNNLNTPELIIFAYRIYWKNEKREDINYSQLKKQAKEVDWNSYQGTNKKNTREKQILKVIQTYVEKD